MDYRRSKDTLYIRVDKGESLTDTIKHVCEREGIQAGHFQGIGACDRVVLGTYIPEKNDFVEHTLTGMLEMVSLMGNVTLNDRNEVFLHSHAMFSYLDAQGGIVTTGGHLLSARVSYTGEIILRPAEERIGRMIDPATGIEVWKLDE